MSLNKLEPVDAESAVTPNSISGIPQLSFEIDKTTPFSKRVYIGANTDRDYKKGKHGIVQATVVICGEEKVVTQNQTDFQYNLV